MAFPSQAADREKTVHSSQEPVLLCFCKVVKESYKKAEAFLINFPSGPGISMADISKGPARFPTIAEL